MYNVKETESALEVRSKTAMGFVWTVLLLTIFLVSIYMGFEYISIKTERTLREVVGASTVQNSKKKKSKKKVIKEDPINTSEIQCYITYFSFREGFEKDSVLLSQILRMDKGYSSSINESNSIFHYNPTFITAQQEHYPLRRISDVAFTPEILSKKFNDFVLNKRPYLNAWDWYMGYWGIAAGISFLGLLFLSVSGRYQLAYFDKTKHTFYIKNYGLLGFVGEEGNWKDIKKIIYQDKQTAHKKGIFFVVKIKSDTPSKKYKTKKIYFTHHTDVISKEVAQKIADLVRPIAKPNSEKNKLVIE